jgi:uncharacterized protein with HEPN domain
MNSRLKKRLFDALIACETIEEFVKNRDLSVYRSDKMLRSAVERQFEIIGEALARASIVDMTLADRFPELPRIVSLRNRLIHGYDSVDDEIIWDIVQFKLSALRETLTE